MEASVKFDDGWPCPTFQGHRPQILQNGVLAITCHNFEAAFHQIQVWWWVTLTMFTYFLRSQTKKAVNLLQIEVMSMEYNIHTPAGSVLLHFPLYPDLYCLLFSTVSKTLRLPLFHWNYINNAPMDPAITGCPSGGASCHGCGFSVIFTTVLSFQVTLCAKRYFYQNVWGVKFKFKHNASMDHYRVSASWRHLWRLWLLGQHVHFHIKR